MKKALCVMMLAVFVSVFAFHGHSHAAVSDDSPCAVCVLGQSVHSPHDAPSFNPQLTVVYAVLHPERPAEPAELDLSSASRAPPVPKAAA